jgi:hypothetical protein
MENIFYFNSLNINILNNGIPIDMIRKEVRNVVEVKTKAKKSRQEAGG